MKRKSCASLAVVFLAVFCLYGAETVEFTLGGQLAFRDGTALYVVTGTPRPGRDGLYFHKKGTVPDAATMTAKIELPDLAEGDVSVSSAADGLRYSATVQCLSAKGEETGGCGIALMLPLSAWSGCTWRTDDGRSGAIPKEMRNWSIKMDRLSSLAVEGRDGKRMEVSFDSPVRLSTTGRKVFFRQNCVLVFSAAGAGRFKEGSKSALSCVVRAGSEIKARAAPFERAAQGGDWIPLENRKDIAEGSALDFSGIGLNDAPAGKFGRVVTSGGHFAFEKRPGVRQRFYGVNLCFGANCPPKEATDALMPRLRRLGYNSIRIHHHEQKLVKGPDGLAPIGRAVDRFDYLVARAIENGLYVTTDLYVSRTVAWRALGIDRDGNVPAPAYKRLVLMGYPPAVENLKEFAKWFLTRTNPHTGRSLAEEPALVSIVLLNEAHLTKGWAEIGNVPYVRKIREEWTAANGNSESSQHRFAVMREMQTEAELREFLRSLGYKGLVSGDNNAPYYVSGRAKLGGIYDYVDRHAYIDHPFFPEVGWRVPYQYENGNALLYPNGYMAATGCARQYGFPFAVSEWNYSGSSPYRSMSGLMTGTLACIQDWDAMWRFSYAHLADDLSDGHGSSQQFNLAGDALLQASDRVAAMLFLRGDVAPARSGVALALPERERLLADGPIPLDAPWAKSRIWTTRIGTAFAGEGHRGVGLVPMSEWSGENPPVRAVAEQGPVCIAEDGSWATVATELTCGGFSEAGNACRAGALAFAVKGHRATVYATSLDGKPLGKSGRILVSHLTDVADEGTEYLGERRNYVLKRGAGNARQLMHAGTADIALAHSESDSLSVWALDTTGRRVRKVPSSVVSGRLRFTAEIADGKSEMYYELAR